MRNLKDIIQEVLVHQHATKDTKKDIDNVTEFKTKKSKVKIYQSKYAKKNITKEVLEQASFIIYDKASLKEFLDTKENSNNLYYICYVRDDIKSRNSYYCANPLDPGKIRLYTGYKTKFEIDYKDAEQNYMDMTIYSFDLEDDYNNNIKEVLIIEIPKEQKRLKY